MRTPVGAKKKLKVAVLGATGVVGQRLVQLLANHPWFTIGALAASESSAGARYGQCCNWIIPDPMPKSVADEKLLSPGAQIDCETVFSALDPSVAGEIESEFRRRGHKVFSNAKNHRLDSDVPLIVPEINSDHLVLAGRAGGDGRIVANPNCSAAILALPLAPVEQNFGIRQLFAVTMQAVSGAGYPGSSFLDVHGNIVPNIAGEEQKIETELVRVFGTVSDDGIRPANWQVSTQANRVPVADGHTISAFVMTDSPAPVAEVRRALASFSGAPQERKLPLAPAQPVYVEDDEFSPQPSRHLMREGGMAVTVGRLREVPGGVAFVVLGHNTIRGAAGTAILNAELYISELGDAV